MEKNQENKREDAVVVDIGSRSVWDKKLQKSIYSCTVLSKNQSGGYKEYAFKGTEPYNLGSPVEMFLQKSPDGVLERVCKQKNDGLYKELDNLEEMFNIICNGTQERSPDDKKYVFKGKFLGDKEEREIDFGPLVEWKNAVAILDGMGSSIFKSCPVVPDPLSLARMTEKQGAFWQDFVRLPGAIEKKIKNEVGIRLLAMVISGGEVYFDTSRTCREHRTYCEEESYKALELRAKEISEEMSEREGKEVNVSPEEALEIIGAKCKWYLIDTFKKELKPALERCKEVFPDLLPGGKELEIAEDKGVVKAEDAPEAGL